MPLPRLKAEAVSVSQFPEGSLQAFPCLAQAAPSVGGQSCGTDSTLPADSCLCWRRRSTGQTLQSGSRASPCRPQREPSWCPGRVCATHSRLSAWPSWLTLAPQWRRGCEWQQWGSTGGLSWGWESLDPLEGHQRLQPPSPDFFVSLSATVSAAVVPSTPIFSPTMAGGSNSSLSLDSGGAEPMPGGCLTPDLYPSFTPPPAPLAVPGRLCQLPQQVRRGSSQRT